MVYTTAAPLLISFVFFLTHPFILLSMLSLDILALLSGSFFLRGGGGGGGVGGGEGGTFRKKILNGGACILNFSRVECPVS